MIAQPLEAFGRGRCSLLGLVPGHLLLPSPAAVLVVRRHLRVWLLLLWVVRDVQ